MLAGISHVSNTIPPGSMKRAAPAVPVGTFGLPARAQKHQMLPILRLTSRRATRLRTAPRPSYDGDLRPIPRSIGSLPLLTSLRK